MLRPAIAEFSDDMMQAFRELVDLLVTEGWYKTDILDCIARRIDPTTEFFAALSELIMDASTR